MQVFLARHGNTFGPGDPVVWVGKRNDLVLVDKGRRQAEALARALRRDDKAPCEVRCGPLARTREFAGIVCEALELDDAIIDTRLDELDYGAWSGLTSDEIRARFGSEELDAWRERSAWPQGAAWPGDAATIKREIRSLTAELRQKHGERQAAKILLVSSNGRLRYFLDLVPGAFDRRVAAADFAVGTGRVGRIDIGPHEASGAVVRYWNVDPSGGRSL